MKNTPILSLAISALIFAGCSNSSESKQKAKPKLILQITVDQLRADLPLKIMDRLPKGGFRYLYDNGVVYQDAHHNHANTETVTGHATLATGAHPADHGMVSNLWYDRASGQAVYNVEDHKYPLIGSSIGVDKNTEIDPTQAAANTDGRSPKMILASTFSDELHKATDGAAKIFGVSVKDRGAITLAGQNGKAFWFSKASGNFISSTYYYTDYPGWVSEWNEKKQYTTYANTTWGLSQEESGYMFSNSDDASYKTKFPGFGIHFPHEFGELDNRYFTTFLTLSPVGDELTLSFTKSLLEAEDIGTDEITDFLAVSFSSTDYVGHVFGPSSIESEDNLFRLDRSIASLLELVDKKVGLENTLIVFSSDHGAVDAPPILQAKGIDAGYIDVSAFDLELLNALVKNKLQINLDVVSAFSYPYIYLDLEKMRLANIGSNQVFPVIKSHLESTEGIMEVVDCKSLYTKKTTVDDHYKLILNNYNPQRSGDFAVVVKPYWYINDFEGLMVATTHGSPWEYDSHVPMIFAGNGLKPQKISRKTYSIDIAVTLSQYLSIQAPSKATGTALKETLSNKN